MTTKIEDMSIAELRATAKSLKIDAQRDWSREAYVMAIEARRKNRHVARVVLNEDEPLQQGYTRIAIPRGEFNNEAPVPISVNGTFQTMIPRETVVDVPNEAVEVLRQSVQPVLKYGDPDSNGNNVPQIVNERSYPFETIQKTKGASGAIKTSNSPEIQGLRVKFRDIFQRWPRRKEFQVFKDEYMARTRATAFSQEEVNAAMAMVNKSREAPQED